MTKINKKITLIMGFTLAITAGLAVSIAVSIATGQVGWIPFNEKLVQYDKNYYFEYYC